MRAGQLIRAPGWVTAVSLCCFCNVALIFATMKTFILQQVKCRHLSYSDWFLSLILVSFDHFIHSLLSPPHHYFPPLLSRPLSFQSSLHLSGVGGGAGVCILGSGIVWVVVGGGGPFPSVHLPSPATVQLLMKSQCPVAAGAL